MGKNTVVAMLGMQNVLEVVDFGVELMNATGKVLEDGKFDWKTETFTFIPAFTKLPSAIKDIDQFVPEFLDMDPDEEKQLQAHVRTAFDIPQDKVEEVIELALETVMALIKNGLKIRKLIKGA